MELSQETIKQIEDFAKESADALYDFTSEMVVEMAESALHDNKVFNIKEGALFMATKYEAAKKRAEERQAEVDRLREGIDEAIIQLRYLNDKFPSTGTTNSLIPRLESLLNQKQ